MCSQRTSERMTSGPFLHGLDRGGRRRRRERLPARQGPTEREDLLDELVVGVDHCGPRLWRHVRVEGVSRARKASAIVRMCEGFDVTTASWRRTAPSRTVNCSWREFPTESRQLSERHSGPRRID